MTNPPPASIARRGIMFVLSSPSGAGKTTISKLMLAADSNLHISVSVTTRAPRPGEVNGKDYIFVSKDTFADMIMNGEFYEHAKVFDHYYGTPKKHVLDQLSAGHDVLFDIDWQGTRQLKTTERRDLVSVFILPPSIAELEQRLRKRAQDSDAVVRARMQKCSDEISHWDEYDYVVVNHDIDDALKRVMAILHAERVRRTRQEGLSTFVDGLMTEFNGTK